MAQVEKQGAKETTSANPPASGSLAEVISIVLDKGIVVDAWLRVSLVGLEILTVQARVVIASVDTYLRYADAIAAKAIAATPTPA